MSAENSDVTLSAPAEVAGPRYVAPIRPLSSQYRPRLMLTRPGALDYRGIPSRIGDTLLPHGGKASATGSGR